MNLPPPMSGRELQAFISSPKERRQAIVEGLIYERSCVMFASHPGVGKSIILVEMCLEISAGLPVFGSFPSRPSKIYYIQKERPVDEVAERVEEMQKVIPWNPDNFVVDSALQTFSLAKADNFGWIIERIAHHKPDIVVIDPIGAGTPGLSKDDPANIFCNFLTALQQATGATNILSHHVVKDSYSSSDGLKIDKEDPFYGSQWLKAHVTGSYLIDKTEHGRRFVNKKDSHSNLIDHFEVAYDHETMTCSTKTATLSVEDRAVQFCLHKKSGNQPFTVKEMTLYLGCDIRTTRRLLVTPRFKTFINRTKSKGYATLYTVLEGF